MGRITGNKGEWSELYAFLKILGDKRIYGADGDMNRREDVYYDVLKIVRDEGNGEIDYAVSDDGLCAEIVSNGKVLVKIVLERFLEESEFLFEAIDAEKATFSIERTENFMDEIRCTKIKASSCDKTDITAQIYDRHIGTDKILGFSIKSMLGSPSTLVNAGRTTNVIFELMGSMTDELLQITNEVDLQKKSKKTLSEKYSNLCLKGVDFIFVDVENQTFEDNMRLIDSKLPEIVAEMLKLHYIEGISKVSDQIRLLVERNPLKYRRSKQPFYEYKIKKLLTSYALGMQSGTPWNGDEDASGGYIIVKKDGEVLCYHLYKRNDFEDYLIKNTKLDTPSTSRYKFSEIYKTVEGKYFLKLNLQIRFIK